MQKVTAIPMKAVFLDFATMGDGLDTGPLRELVDELVVHATTDDADIESRLADAEIVFTNKNVLRADRLAQAPRLRFVGLTATGTDNVDLDAARAAGIAVANITAYCTQSVVEHVIGAMLALTHNLGRYVAATRAGRWQRSDSPFVLDHPIRELSALTLGIVGYGELGRGVARAAEFFGMDVLVAARRGTDPIADGRVAFEDLLARADVISLHCPLNDATRGLIGRAELAAMRETAILINTARGGLVDSAALADALRNADIAGAAIDVLPQEPPRDGDPLLDYLADDGGRGNLLVTPHIAWATLEARQNAIDELAANTAAFLRGDSRNRVA